MASFFAAVVALLQGLPALAKILGALKGLRTRMPLGVRKPVVPERSAEENALDAKALENLGMHDGALDNLSMHDTERFKRKADNETQHPES